MKDLSLYIHIPFCKTICLYCNFLTFAHKNKKIPHYIESLIKEIAERSANYKNHEIKTIYFGGGTPSLIDPNFIVQILDSIRQNFNIVKNPEISLECNPESVDQQRIEKYKKIGINRISLGIQSFNKKTLLRIARPHDHLSIFKALDIIKNSGIKNFGADFIMGLPYQTLKSFKEELKTILSYDPAHLSFYFLSYDTKKIDLFIKDSPQENEQIKMYKYLTKTLKKHGYLHYEVSNYAKPGYECEHNQRYWQQKDYLGLGLGAHSIVNNKMWQNQEDFEIYLRDPLITKDEMEIDKELKRMEDIMLSLRTDQGLNLKEFSEKFGKNEYEKIIAKADTYLKSKHLTLTKNIIIPTEKGFLILDKITTDLI